MLDSHVGDEFHQGEKYNQENNTRQEDDFNESHFHHVYEFD